MTRALLAAASMVLAVLLGTSAPTMAQSGPGPHEPTLVLEAGNHAGAVRRIAVSPDQALLATVSDDKTARVWEVATRRLLMVLRWPIGPGDLGRMYGVAFSPDGRELAVGGTSGSAGGGHRLQVYSAVNGQPLRSLPLDAGHVVRLLWTRDARHLVACLAGTHGVRILTATGGPAFADRFDGPCYGLAELPDGGILASGYDGRIRLYRERDGRWQLERQVATDVGDPRSLAVSPDGRHVAVGYSSRHRNGQAPVDVLDATTLATTKRFWFSDLHRDQAGLGSVAWSRDGRTIAAAGRATENGGIRARVVLKRIAWPDGAASSDFAATDTVQDLAPWGEQGFVLATGQGSWTAVQATGPVSPIGAAVVDLRGPDNLAIDGSARTVSFGAEGWSGARHFALGRREAAEGPTPGTDTARRRSLSVSVQDWQDRLRPLVGGREQPMEPAEVSRSMALLPDNRAVILGTSRTLRRVAPDGRTEWSVRAPSEVTAVHASQDGRLVVGTLLDGTVRWWRATDGALLLSLFTALDGRWVLWTEQGYYDTSVGAESLVGWHLERADGRAVDFFSIGKFRDRYHRPDVVDRVLDTLDPVQALAAADAQRRLHVDAGPLENLATEGQRVAAVAPAVQAGPRTSGSPANPAAPSGPTAASGKDAASSGSAGTDRRAQGTGAAPPRPPLQQPPPVAVSSGDARLARSELAAGLPAVTMPAAVQADPIRRVLPPVVSIYNERSIQGSDRRLQVRFSVQAGGLPARTMRVRIDGRPAEPTELVMPDRQDGEAIGHLVLAMPASNAEVLVMADAGVLISEPVQLAWVWRPSAPARPPGGAPGTLSAGTDGPARPAPGAPVAPGPSAGPGAAPSRLFVVAIGVSAYARRDYALDLPAKDASDFAALMKGQGGRMYSSVEARLLTDAAATRSAVLDALSWLRQAAGPRDTAMLFIAGHGVNDAGGRYFFLPHDGDVDRLAQSAVSEAHLRQSLAAVRGKAVLFVDTCHAGNVVGTGAALNTEIARLANTLAAAENGVIVFSSSTGRQESIEQASWGNGAFTKALIEGLRGGADFRKEGVVTHHGLSYFLGREVARLTKGRQTPVTAVPVGVIDYPVVALTGS